MQYLADSNALGENKKGQASPAPNLENLGSLGPKGSWPRSGVSDTDVSFWDGASRWNCALALNSTLVLGEQLQEAEGQKQLLPRSEDSCWAGTPCLTLSGIARPPHLRCSRTASFRRSVT